LIDRRTFLAGAGAVLLAAPPSARAQQPGKVYRVGSLAEEFTTPMGQGPFYDRLRELGWVNGRNLVVERRAYGDQIDRIPEFCTELMRSGVDVFIVSGGIAVRLQQVTRTIPIVASNAADLVQFGLAASLARPGGNVTGIQTLTTDLVGKQFALLKEAIPGFSRSGLLMGEHGSSEPEYASKMDAAIVREAEASGKTLGIRLQIVRVYRAEDLDAAFSVLPGQRAQGILLWRNPFMFALRKGVVALALKHRLPTISEIPTFATDGGLASYGYDSRETSRLMAETIDKILRGAKASEIPVQQTTTFRLIINLAKALGLTIPPSLLGRADQVIE
jgi:putative ABC transport system substrate-binding protein